MKYIVLESPDGLRFFAFPASLDHDGVARALQEYGRPVRAGFVQRSVSGPVCYGGSISLGLRSDPIADAGLFQEQLDDRCYG